MCRLGVSVDGVVDEEINVCVLNCVRGVHSSVEEESGLLEYMYKISDSSTICFSDGRSSFPSISVRFYHNDLSRIGNICVSAVPHRYCCHFPFLNNRKKMRPLIPTISILTILFSIFMAVGSSSVTSDFLVGFTGQAATVKLAQQGETFQRAVNNDDSGIILLFTGRGPVVYILNCTGLPLQSYNNHSVSDTLPSRTVRLNLVDLDNSISNTEILTGGWIVTRGDTDDIYLFGRSTIYCLSQLNNTFYISKRINTIGLQAATIATVYNNNMYIPSNNNTLSIGSVTVVNLDNYQVTYYTTRIIYATDIYYRQTDGLIFITGFKVNSDKYQVEVRVAADFSSLGVLNSPFSRGRMILTVLRVRSISITCHHIDCKLI